jgi:hypothetical protein
MQAQATPPAPRNVDDLLIADTQTRLGQEVYVPKPIKLVESIEPEILDDANEDEKTNNEPAVKPDVSLSERDDISDDDSHVEEKKSSASESRTDDYGTELPEPKTYTEDEVNEMIRDRLSRGRYAQNNNNQQTAQEIAKSFTPDPNSEDNWQAQLTDFVNQTIEKREQKLNSKAQMEREHRTQAEFETKFTSGMTKYRDFETVIAGKPITDSMMLATRGMNDPAAFIYAASKNYSKDLERIASITDPFQQGTEIGRLEEKMKKARTVSKASRPITPTRGDATDVRKEVSKPSIDSLIISHAKSKRLR